MTLMRLLRLTILGLMLGVAAGAAAAELWPNSLDRGAGEPLYFSLKVERAGQVVAQPQLLGESGKAVRLFLSTPDGQPRLALDLHPRQVFPYDGTHFTIDAQLDLPDEHGLRQALSVRHGEEVSTQLSEDVKLTLLTMRVRSPEFEAWVREAPARVENPVEPE